MTQYTPDEIGAALARVYKDPIAFGWSLGYQGTRSGRKEFGDFHRALWNHAESGPRTSTIVPRGHAKSTLISVIGTAHHLLQHPESRNLMGSASLDLGTLLVGELRDRLRGDLELLPGLSVSVAEAFPWLAVEGDPRRSGPCESFNIVGRSGSGREASVFVASVGSNLAGNHPTRAVIDDPVNEQNSRTPSRRKQCIEFIEQLEPLMFAADSPIRHVGTPWAFSDVSSYLAQREDWSQFRFGVWDGTNPDTQRHDGEGPGPKGTYPLCPSFLNTEEIEKKQRNLSKVFFASQYDCQPIPSEEALFEPALVKGATDQTFALERLPDGPEIMLFDPVARIDGRVGDLNGIVIVRALTAKDLGLKGHERDRNIFVPVYAKEIKGGADAAANWIENQGVPSHPLLQSIWIEQVASQTLFGPWLEERGKIKGVRIRGQKIGTVNLPYRLMALQTGFRKGYIVFPPAFPGREMLITRMLEFPLSDSDDVISALALLSTMMGRRGDLPGIERKTPMPDAMRVDWHGAGKSNGNYWPKG